MAKDEYSAGEVELTLFQAKECYVYKIPPRMSTLSYRADEWDVNKWVWEGACRVVATGSQCDVRLEDAKTGELFARAPVRADGQPAFETVIDSSPHAKHAFIGFGFRERTEAYDFQAAIHDHLQYLSRQKEAEVFAEKFADASRPPIDLSIKEGQSIRLNIPHVSIVRRSSLSVIDPEASGFEDFPSQDAYYRPNRRVHASPAPSGLACQQQTVSAYDEAADRSHL
eukprot:jgi/Chlat1/7207/Chrsp57S06854